MFFSAIRSFFNGNGPIVPKYLRSKQSPFRPFTDAPLSAVSQPQPAPGNSSNWSATPAIASSCLRFTLSLFPLNGKPDDSLRGSIILLSCSLPGTASGENPAPGTGVPSAFPGSTPTISFVIDPQAREKKLKFLRSPRQSTHWAWEQPPLASGVPRQWAERETQ